MHRYGGDRGAFTIAVIVDDAQLITGIPHYRLLKQGVLLLNIIDILSLDSVENFGRLAILDDRIVVFSTTFTVIVHIHNGMHRIDQGSLRQRPSLREALLDVRALNKRSKLHQKVIDVRIEAALASCSVVKAVLITFIRTTRTAVTVDHLCTYLFKVLHALR